MIQIPTTPLSLKTGDAIALQAANAKYLSLINRGDTNPIEAAKSDIDYFCHFTVVLLDDGRIALQSPSNGKYLSMINRGDTNPIEAAKSQIDVYSEFSFLALWNASDDGYLVLSVAGKFLSMINRGDTDPIEAAKSCIDQYCQFKYSRVS